MYDEPPPRPFHTFKFPHITVEVETTPQVCHDIYGDMIYDICSLTLLLRWKQRLGLLFVMVSLMMWRTYVSCISYLMKPYIIFFIWYISSYCGNKVGFHQRANSIAIDFVFGSEESIWSKHTSWFWKMMILSLKKKELIFNLFCLPLQFVALKNEDPQNQLCIKFKTLMTPSKIGRMQVYDDEGL